MRLFILFFGLIFFVACKKDEVPPNPYALDPARFPPQISEHVNTFMKEADKRGIKIELDKRIASFILTDNIQVDGIKNVAGDYSVDYRIIYIDTTSATYKKCPELLVFHEMGHAVLDRDHRTDELFNGKTVVPASIMFPSAPCLSDSTMFERQYYIDELFNKNTPCPAWGKPVVYI